MRTLALDVLKRSGDGSDEFELRRWRDAVFSLVLVEERRQFAAIR